MKRVIAADKKVLQYFVIALAGLFLARIFFYINNHGSFSSLTSSEVIGIFFFAIRFDLWSLCFVFMPLILIHVFPYDLLQFRGARGFAKYYFLITLPVILLPDFVDSEYSKFTGKRSTSDLFTLITTGDDTLTLMPDFLRDFWFVALTWVAVSAFLIIVFLKIRKRNVILQEGRPNHLISFLNMILISGLCVLCLRGAGFRPVSINTALAYTKSAGINLVLNSSFTIISTIDKDYLPEKKFFDNKEALNYFNPVSCFSDTLPVKHDNVVIIIFEGLTSEYCGYINGAGFTPFTDSLFSKSLVFEYSYANGKKSPEALSSIYAGIPTLFDQPYNSSQYVNNRIFALPALLCKHSYHTAFFHGGKNGTMDFDLFAFIAGVNEYYGLNEYPDKSQYDGNWGVWDGPYLQYFAEKLNGFKQPFMATVFTLSSHHPYNVPPEYSYLPEGWMPIHKAIGYSDAALMDFFKTAEKQEWYMNTLFVITGDHTSQTGDERYLSRTGTYRVPICFFHPSDTLLRGKRNEIAQHSDIFPTVVNYLGFSDSILSFGKSLLSGEKHYIFNYLSGVYWVCDGEYYLLFDGDKSIGLYKFPEDILEKENLLLLKAERAEKLEKVLMSVIQQYNNKVKNNQLIAK